jgi:hypothetical protein
MPVEKGRELSEMSKWIVFAGWVVVLLIVALVNLFREPHVPKDKGFPECRKREGRW